MNFSLTWPNIRNYLILLVIFLAVDSLWLLVIAKKLYASRLGYLMADRPNLPAALAFYLLFILGLKAFVLDGALAGGCWQAALLPGLLFGLVTYATYDLTNLATVRDWPLLVTFLDLGWGAAVSGLSALGGYLFIRLLR